MENAVLPQLRRSAVLRKRRLPCPGRRLLARKDVRQSAVSFRLFRPSAAGPGLRIAPRSFGKPFGPPRRSPVRAARPRASPLSLPYSAAPCPGRPNLRNRTPRRRRAKQKDLPSKESEKRKTRSARLTHHGAMNAGNGSPPATGALTAPAFREYPFQRTDAPRNLARLQKTLPGAQKGDRALSVAPCATLPGEEAARLDELQHQPRDVPPRKHSDGRA